MKGIVLWAVLGYIAGILLAYLKGLECAIEIVLLLLLTISIKIFLIKGKKEALLTIAIGFVLIGSVMFELTDDVSLKPIGQFIGKPIVFTCKVTEAAELKRSKVEYVVRVNTIEADGQYYSLSSKVLLSCYAKNNLNIYQYGDILKVKGVLYKPQLSMNEGGFDYNLYLKSQGIYSCATVSPEQIIKLEEIEQRNIIYDFAFYIRQFVIKSIDIYLPDEEAALLKGILVGDRTDFTSSMLDDFTRSGLMHLVAVSGLHVSIFLMGVTFLLHVLKMRKIAVGLMCIIVTLMFIFVTGCTPSVVRAGIMSILFYVGSILNRESDTLTSLLFSALVILLFQPCTLFHAGFQLSFGATLGILVFYQPLYEGLNTCYKFISSCKNEQRGTYIGKALGQIFVASFAAQIGTIPLIAYHFNYISLMGIIANLAVIPIAPVVLISGIILCIVGSISTPIGNLAAGFVYVFLKIIRIVSATIAKLPFAVAKVRSPGILFIIIYFIVLYILYRLLDELAKQSKKINGTNINGLLIKHTQNRVRIISASVLLLIVILLDLGLSFWNFGDLEVNFINVGQGDCIVIRCENSKTVLIDAGTGSDTYDVGKNLVIPYLMKKGIMNIDLAIVSHYHEDHAGGIISVLDEMPVKMMLLPFGTQDSEIKQRLLNTAESRQVPVYYISTGDIIDLKKDMIIEILSPDTGEMNSNVLKENNRSIVMMLCYGNVSFLFTGDIEKDMEQQMVKQYKDINAHVLKIPHHGSGDSSTEAFLSAVSPRYSVISVGKNSFGHPAGEVLQRLEYNNCEVFRTDINGNITFITDKRQIKSIRTYREGEPK